MPDQAGNFDHFRAALADRYRIERELGAGGMATVYLAHDIKHDRTVALKVLRPELAAIIGGERFLREIKLTARLNHPHILPLLDSGEAGHVLFYVMPYVEGDSLRDKLRRETQLSIDDALGLAQQVAGALQHAHEQGIMHRDIKPENILLHDGEAMVADFGIALALNTAGGDRLTETGLSIGTPEYMSPEQASGGEHLDARSDVYGLGCVLYEMLTGEPPFTGSSSQAVIARQVLDPPPSIRTVRSSVSAEVEGVVQRALAKAPADRWQTAEKLGTALSAAARGVDVTSGGRVGPIIRRTLASTTNLAIGMGVLVAGLLAVLIVTRLAPSSSTFAHPRPTQLTFNGRIAEAEVSPDGEYLAYVEETDSNRLYVHDLTSGGVIQIANVGINLNGSLRWSPDGAALLVQRAISGGWMTSLFPRLGAPAQPLPRYASGNAIWSPDGSQIATWRPNRNISPAAMAAFGISDPIYTIRLMTVATGDTSFIAIPDSFDQLYRGDWSPNGSFIAVEALRTGQSSPSLWTVAVDGSGWLPVLDDSGRTRLFADSPGPRWSPKGDAIYYLAYLGARNWELRKQAIASDGTKRGEAQVVPTGPLQTYGVSITADGKKLVYIVHEQAYNLWLAVPTNDAGQNGFRTTQLTYGSAVHTFGRVSPDGKQVAYVVLGTEETGDVFVVPTTGGAPRRITASGNVQGAGPVWSPDGSTLGFVVQHDQGNSVVQTARLDGGQIRTYADIHVSRIGLSAFTGGLTWAPGERLLYQTNDGNISSLDVQTGEHEIFVAGDSAMAGVWGLRYAPDGKRVVGSTRRGIEVISLDDMTRRIVYARPRRVVSATRVQVPTQWSDDGASVYVQNRDSLLLVPVEGGDVKVVSAVPSFGYRESSAPATSVCVIIPRRSELSFVCRVVRSFRDAWMIENFDPVIR